MFAQLTTIEPILEAIKGRDEFYVNYDNVRGVGTVIYSYKDDDTFNTPDPTSADYQTQLLIQECRGLTYDLETGEILSRPYHKFKNYKEDEFHQAQHIDLTNPHTILAKLDGTMIFPVVRADALHWSTKAGYTDHSEIVYTAFGEGTNEYNFAYYCQVMNLTPIFEYVSFENKIVVEYKEPQLVLTAIRENKSGRYYAYGNMLGFATNHGVNVVGSIGFSTGSIEDLAENISKLKDIEGFIIRFEDGRMIKLKTLWYVNIHSAIEDLKFEKNALRLIIDDQLDDVRPHLPEHLRTAVNTYETAVMQFILGKIRYIKNFTDSFKAERSDATAKEFYAIVEQHDLEFAFFYMETFKGNATEDYLFSAWKTLVRKYVFNKVLLEQKKYLVGHVQYGA